MPTARCLPLCLGFLLFLSACPAADADAETAPRVANPTRSGVVCRAQSMDDAGAAADSDCVKRFYDCSDGLSYEVECQGGRCDCLVDGDLQGKFASKDASTCDVDIGQLKILCGWNSPGVTERKPAP